jgi:DNA polymerase-3 subunit epsilon
MVEKEIKINLRLFNIYLKRLMLLNSQMTKYIVFDVETTGLPKDYKASPKLFELWPHIVQFSWLVVDKNITEKSYIIKPDKYIIPVESSNIHNITTEDAIQNGHSLKDVLQIFKNDCSSVDFVVAHNASFDITVVLAACYRLKENVSFLKNKKAVCTMKSTTNICKLPGKYGYKYPKLEELFFFLFKENPNVVLHNALEDSKVTLKCYIELCNRNIKMI